MGFCEHSSEMHPVVGKRRKPFAVWLISLFALFLISGCSLGPQLIRGSRTKYNNAVQSTASDEMLLNLVRIRYGDPPGFLAVTGITTQLEIDGGVSLGNEFGLGAGRWAGNLNAADRPTISLTPLQDEQFTRRFLSPISLETIYLFTRNGQNVERMLRLAVDQINGVRNTHEPEGPDGVPGPFVWLARTLDQLAEQQQIEVAYEHVTNIASPPLSPENVQGGDVVAALENGYQFQSSGVDSAVVLISKDKELVLRFAPLAPGLPEVAGIIDLLKLRRGETSFPLELAVEGQLKPPLESLDALHVSTRSVEEILHFLCHGVSVPPAHVKNGLVSLSKGCSSGCAGQSSDLIRVESCRLRPRHAAVAVHHQGHWFYINDADAASKETFELLLELYNLEIRGGGANALPVLTLPLSR